MTKSEKAFLVGETDEVPGGLLDSDEVYILEWADADYAWTWAQKRWELLEVDRDLYGLGDIRRGILAEARLLLAGRVHLIAAATDRSPEDVVTGRGSDAGMGRRVSERTEQRWMRRHSDEIRKLLGRRGSGRPMSIEGAADRVRAAYTWETGTWHRTCPVCRQAFKAKRSDAVCCSATCRKRKQQGSRTRWKWQPGTPGSPYTRSDNSRD